MRVGELERQRDPRVVSGTGSWILWSDPGPISSASRMFARGPRISHRRSVGRRAGTRRSRWPVNFKDSHTHEKQPRSA